MVSKNTLLPANPSNNKIINLEQLALNLLSTLLHCFILDYWLILHAIKRDLIIC